MDPKDPISLVVVRPGGTVQVPASVAAKGEETVEDYVAAELANRGGDT